MARAIWDRDLFSARIAAIQSVRKGSGWLFLGVAVTWQPRKATRRFLLVLLKYQGASVKGGTLTFSPVGGTDQAGKPATAEVQQDGSYTLGTNSAGDGACVGRHRITYTPPSVELTDQQRTDPKYIAPQPPYAGLEPKQVEVEVKSGPNTIAIELVPARRK